MVTVNGAPSTLTVALDDGYGNAFDVASISYTIKDEYDRVLVAPQALPGFVASDTSATVVVTGAVNTIVPPVVAPANPSLATSAYRSLRIVVLTCILTTGETVVLTSSYVVQLADFLIVGVNSFQTLSFAKMTALDVPNLSYFFSATDAALNSALAVAAERIKQYRFRLDETEWGYQQNMVKGWFVGNLNLLNPSDFAQLPEQFKKALRMAQVAEAEFVMTGAGVDASRDGLVSEKIGEVTNTYSEGTKIKLNISRPALNYIGRFINYSPRIARA